MSIFDFLWILVDIYYVSTGLFSEKNTKNNAIFVCVWLYLDLNCVGSVDQHYCIVKGHLFEISSKPLSSSVIFNACLA